MAKKVAINGFGRIGRLTFRNLLQNPDVEVVAINDLTDNATLAHLLKYDSTQGIFAGTVDYTADSLIVDGKTIHASAERNPAALPWAEMDVDVVLECTGIFRDKAKAGLHLEAGAKKVVISAPGKGDGIQTIVLGVNDDTLDTNNTIFSNASCTTNCLSPLVKVIVDNWGLVQGTMTTTHAYTGDQMILDAPHSDLRRARAAAVNIIPTSTGAAEAVGKVIPSVAGKIMAMAVRVPVPTGSMTELTVITDKAVSAEEVNAKFKEYADGAFKGVMEFSTAPLVSSDIVGNKNSCIFDSKLTLADGKLLKVVGWYDNEAGYSARLAELTARV
ncbi:MAG: glyceraldehyde 3-phosphate dehydrogenase [Cognaticolwellia sp.]|jgi:glyceraldehyde 3-phosphate dehydrogenase